MSRMLYYQNHRRAGVFRCPVRVEGCDEDYLWTSLIVERKTGEESGSDERAFFF